MRKTIKRVFLVDDMTNQSIVYGQDFLGSLPDFAILCALHEVEKTVWIGNELFHIVRSNGQVRYLRYEVCRVRVR